MKKARKIMWGSFLLLAGAMVIINGSGTFIGTFPLLCCILVIPIMLESLLHLNFWGIFIPPAIIGIIFRGDLGIEHITPWPLLAAAVLLSIGCSVLFGKSENSCGRCGYFHLEEKVSIDDIPDDDMTCNVNFGASSKYIRSQNFELAYFNCNFGSIKAYFDNAKLSPNGARLHITAKFSGIELFIPKHWKVANNVSAVLAGVEEKTRNMPDPNSPVLTLTGNISLSGIVIYYV